MEHKQQEARDVEGFAAVAAGEGEWRLAEDWRGVRACKTNANQRLLALPHGPLLCSKGLAHATKGILEEAQPKHSSPTFVGG
jgi:hypothetical protein